MNKLKPEIVFDARARIGESPTWSATEQALYWIDIKAPALYRLDPENKNNCSWPLPDEIGAFALYANEAAALVALRSGIHRLDLGDGKLRKLADPPYEPWRFRFNEGACDPQGRFWVGTMYEPKEEAGEPEPGPLFCFTLERGLVRQPDGALTPNGLCWNPAGDAMYFARSKERRIYIHDFDGAQGSISEARLFAEMPERPGIPDGAAVDEEGCYWSAIHGGSCLIRFRPDGSVEREIDLPVSQPTMPAFGGPDRDILYVTSAAAGLALPRRLLEPQAGGIFCLMPSVRGVPLAGFAG